MSALADEYIRETTSGTVRGYGYDPDREYSEIYVPDYIEKTALINEEYFTEIYMGIPYAQKMF